MESGNHEGRILVLENKLEDIKTLIVEIKEDNKEMKKDYQDIKLQVAELGNGGFRKIIIETNEKLMHEILNRDKEDMKFKLEKDKSKWKYIVEKNKIVFTFLGGAAGIKLIELASELIKKLIN